MVAIRFYLGINSRDVALPAFVRSTTRAREKVLRSFRGAAQDAAEEITVLGRQDIQASGNFGDRWIQGLHVRVSEGGGNIRIATFHDIPFFKVFLRGALIKGKPLLWVPLSSAPDAKGINAKSFPGRLVRVQRLAGGPPLLLSVADKQAKYVGLTQVRIPKKFHTDEIVRSVGSQMRNIYNQRYRSDPG